MIILINLFLGSTCKYFIIFFSLFFTIYSFPYSALFSSHNQSPQQIHRLKPIPQRYTQNTPIQPSYRTKRIVENCQYSTIFFYFSLSFLFLFLFGNLTPHLRTNYISESTASTPVSNPLPQSSFISCETFIPNFFFFLQNFNNYY